MLRVAGPSQPFLMTDKHMCSKTKLEPSGNASQQRSTSTTSPRTLKETLAIMAICPHIFIVCSVHKHACCPTPAVICDNSLPEGISLQDSLEQLRNFCLVWADAQAFLAAESLSQYCMHLACRLTPVTQVNIIKAKCGSQHIATRLCERTGARVLVRYGMVWELPRPIKHITPRSMGGAKTSQ